MITELKDTCALMDSDDYRERFMAEYFQLKIRLEKLKAFLEKWDRNELEFIPNCPRETYNFQIKAMQEYHDILVIRAEIENIEIRKPSVVEGVELKGGEK